MDNVLRILFSDLDQTVIPGTAALTSIGQPAYGKLPYLEPPPTHPVMDTENYLAMLLRIPGVSAAVRYLREKSGGRPIRGIEGLMKNYDIVYVITASPREGIESALPPHPGMRVVASDYRNGRIVTRYRKPEIMLWLLTEQIKSGNYDEIIADAIGNDAYDILGPEAVVMANGKKSGDWYELGLGEDGTITAEPDGAVVTYMFHPGSGKMVALYNGKEIEIKRRNMLVNSISDRIVEYGGMWLDSNPDVVVRGYPILDRFPRFIGHVMRSMFGFGYELPGEAVRAFLEGRKEEFTAPYTYDIALRRIGKNTASRLSKTIRRVASLAADVASYGAAEIREGVSYAADIAAGLYHAMRSPATGPHEFAPEPGQPLDRGYEPEEIDDSAERTAEEDPANKLREAADRLLGTLIEFLTTNQD